MVNNLKVPRVLVAYASKHGATAEIAQRIAATLSASGVSACAYAADIVQEPTQYHAIVLGSAVYAGNWMKEAVQFMVDNEAALVSRPIWLFSSGPVGAGDPATLLGGWQFPHDQQALADRIQPRDVALFHGKIDMDKLGFGERMLIKAMKGKTGDYRDWAKIDSWSRAIAESVKSHLAVPS
jgi:menaquinone-dependent protoporphyrinogen oxidase